MHSCIPTVYECDLDFGKRLYEASLVDETLYDEIGHKEYGWFGLVVLENSYYVLSCVKGIFRYTYYKSYKAASKAWDHVCTKFERWFIKHYG